MTKHGYFNFYYKTVCKSDKHYEWNFNCLSDLSWKVELGRIYVGKCGDIIVVFFLTFRGGLSVFIEKNKK